MVGEDDHIVAFLHHRDLAKNSNFLDSVGGFPRSAYSVLLRYRRSRSNEAPGGSESGLAASNNKVSRDEHSTKCSGAALIKETPWDSHTTAATGESTSVGSSTASTLARPRRTIFPPRPRSRPPPTSPLLLWKYLTKLSNCNGLYLTQMSDRLTLAATRKVFDERRQSNKGRLEAHLSIRERCGRRSEVDRCGSQQFLVLPLHRHIEFQTAIVTD